MYVAWNEGSRMAEGRSGRDGEDGGSSKGARGRELMVGA